MPRAGRSWAICGLLLAASAGCQSTPPVPPSAAVRPAPLPTPGPNPPSAAAASEFASLRQPTHPDPPGPDNRVRQAGAEQLPTPRPLPGNLPPGDGPIGPEELLALAGSAHPDIAAARARADVARGKLIQAGLYPNPLVSYRHDEINQSQNAAGFLAMEVTQNLPRRFKRKLDQQAAAAGVQAADFQAMTQWFLVLTRLRQAYIERLAALREVAAAEEMVTVAEMGLKAAEKVVGSGAGTRLDVLQARAELDQSRVRVEVARERAAAASRLLAAAAGLPALPDRPLVDVLDLPIPAYDADKVTELVRENSSELREAEALAVQAERMMRRAEEDPRPDYFLTVRPLYYSFPDQKPFVFVQFGGLLPVFNRNQGNIAAARAEAIRAREAVGQLELRLRERVAAAYQRYAAARRQVEAFRRSILPAAEESARLVRQAFEKGDAKFDYLALLQAQRALALARVNYVTALGEVWKAAAEIAGLVQIEGAPPR